MASRRQKQFDRKYSSYRKYTASEDVNYSSHSARSSFRSESMTSRSDTRGRSVSSEIVTGSDTRSYPVYIAIQDYQPEPTDVEGIPLEQGQIVEVLDKKNPASWLVRTKARPPKSGWIPGSYFETPTEYYKQRRRTREIESTSVTMTEDQEALLKRDQVFHDLLRTEEEFVAELRSCVDNYIRILDDANVPPAISKEKEKLALNLTELYNFHANVMLKGLNYYSDDPGKVGQTFIRLERDFDHHVQFFKDLPATLDLLEQQPFKDFFQSLADKYEAGAHTFTEHLKNVSERVTHYQNFFKEFVKYSARANQSSKSMQKALELTMGIPQRVHDLIYTNNILQYPGDTNKLGRLIRHDSFEVAEGSESEKKRYVFLFKNKLMITEKNDSATPTTYTHLATIRLDKYTVSTHVLHDDTIILKPNEPGLPSFSLRPSDLTSSEYTKKAWLKDIAEEQEAYAAEHEHETETVSEFDMHLSDMRSEFSEYSGSRKSPFGGPEEGGPPRKKVKSPPAISPTGSSTSIYSGGSSSIDWTTTGTTLEMQGTRVTRTQYGFRTLQESSAKMCLKVTGYPLPEISWYKDDVQLHEDERHTFYADEDGFFALTIDPVQVEDTGRYTCMATNEYGQASTSAFFRVLKVEKEAAPPKFVNALKDRECKEGEMINFECEVEGWPEPELVWLVDDQPLRPSHDFKIEYDGMKAHLEIRDAQPDDTGVYTVKIQNEFGTAESKAELIVVPDPDKNHVAPEFQATIEDVECDEGDEVRFKSVITGDPNPEIVWMINGIPLSESEKIRFISEDGICILIIKDVTRHFDGTVTCQGTNRLGTTSCDGRLKVRVPPAPPSFAKPLEDRVVQENAVVSFDVDVLGFPEPAVTFHLKGKELKHGVDGVEIAGSDGYYKVIISGCKLDDHDGEIICRAVNEHGAAESRARLTVEPMEEESRSAPTFIKDIEDQTVKFGEHAVFETTVRGSPNPEVTWFINGQRMDKDTPGVKIEFVNHDHKLTIDSAQYAGTVLCRAENVVGRFETKARLTVIPQEKPKKAPRFTELLSDKTEVESSTVVFEARVEAEPKPDVKWFLKGVELTASENVVIRDFDGSVKLELRGIKLEDAGEVRCEATNSEGSAISAAQLGVSRKPFPPSFDQQPKSLTVERGSEARFEAHAEASPAPTYQWSIDGRKIRESTEGCRVEMIDGVSVLTVNTSIHSATSTISVIAENSLGADETGARLTVEEKKVTEQKVEVSESKTTTTTTEEGKIEISQIEVAPTKSLVTEESVKEEFLEQTKITGEPGAQVTTTEQVSEQMTATTTSGAEVLESKVDETAKLEESQKVETQQKIEIPKVTRDLKDQTVVKGEQGRFEVVIEHATETKWYHNGKELTTTTEGVKITEETKYEFKLTIDSSTYPTGAISVKGINESGTAESKCEMKVVEKPELTEKLGDIKATLGEPIKVEVAAKSAPQFKWMINGQTLQDGKDGVHVATDGDKSTLMIDKAEPAHSGKLTVVTTNEAGTIESSSQITVSPKEAAPQIVDGPKSVTIKEKETAEFKVKISGYPEPSVKWMINDKIVEESSTTTTSRFESEYSLRITETTTSSSGTVKVTAENTVGSASSTADLKVEQSMSPPNFKSQLTDLSVKEDEQLQLDVSLDSAQPGTTVKWYVNGKELQQSPDVQITDEGNGNHRLTIKHVKEDQAGTLTVKAMNPVGECECTAKLIVEKSMKKPEFTKTPQNHEVYTDEDSVKFSAVVIGTAPITVVWYLNEKKIESSDEIKTKYEEDTGKTSIRIYKPQISQSGTVRVTAENSAGSVEASATLKVDRRAEVPKFTSNMDDRQVNEGETVKYTSTVEGYPEPAVEWLLNGEPVSKHANITVSDDAGKHTIEIKDITPEQSGELSCQASNSSGMKKQNVALNVKRVGEAPTFTKNIEDRLVTEGEVTIMEAKLNEVKPKPTVTWLRDGKEITSDDHFQLSHAEDGTLQLKIITTKMEDKSRITIKAENYFGTAECSASLGVVKQRPMAKPAFQSDIAPINLTEGDSLQTKLLITGDPTPFVKWYINNQMVCETEDTEIKNVDGVYSLTIHGVTSSMTGKIKCVAYNKMGEVSTEGPLKVVAPVPVEFETSLCDATCREGDTLKLKAVLLGEPTPEVSWYVNGKKLEESQNIKIHSEKGTYTVTIKDITCDYSGKVVCEAINEYGRASSEAMLLVLPRGEPPDFIEWLSNVRARKESKVVHKVVFTGDPKPVLTWYINNKEVTNSDEISIVTDDKVSTLTIHKFNPDKHVGEIICKAENDAGEVSCTANMVTYTSEMFSESESEAQAEEVIADDMTLTDDESLREELVRTPTPVMAPKFITKIKDSRAKRGHEAIFECVVPDTKGVCCKWLKDGKEIELIARIRVQTRTIEGFTTQELIIDDVRPEDAGVYTVIVENTAGRDQCDATLTVLEVLDKVPERAPEFIVKLQDKTTKTNDTVTFECKVVGEPRPTVSWYHENTVLEEHAKQVFIESEEGIQRLVITSTEMKHEGKYSCVAENTAGSSRTEATLKVEETLAPTFTKSLTDQSISIGDQLVLLCSVKGAPQPTVEFYHETVRIKSSGRISVEHDKTNTHWRMIIKEITQEDLGKYHATAKNSAGAAISEATVSSRTIAPAFEQGLKRTSVKEKEEIRMEVKITGTEPEVSWFKDGEPVKQDTVHEILHEVSTGTYTLIVKESHTSDAGTYTVKASNVAGAAESSAEVEVTHALEKPTFVKELVSTEVKINESAKLEVTVKGVPAPEVTWKKDGQPVTIDNVHILSKKDDQGTFSITISSATLEDVGKYSCEAINLAGSAECSANFAVVKEMEVPSFTEKLQPLEIKETESATLSVTVTGSPQPKIQWFKDDAPVQIDNVHIVAKDEGSGHYVLTIKEAKITDKGSYSCKATNEAGEARTEASVMVAKESTAPQFTETLKSLEVKETETVKLAVTVVGSPEPTVAWFKDDVPIQIDNVHVLSKDEGSGHFTLTIKDSRLTDIGSYSCKATNEAGEARTEATVHVAKESTAPQFTETLKPLEVKETEMLKLSVTVTGSPEPKVQWFKDDFPIQIDHDHVLSQDEGQGHFILIVKDARLTDVGSYSCKATNDAGEARTEAKMAVIEDLVTPHFVEGLKPLEVDEGKPAELTCSVVGKPEPEITWLKNGLPIQIDESHIAKKDSEGHHTLFIKDLKAEDFGSYTCQAVNKAGKDETMAEIKIPKYGFEKTKTEEVQPLFIEPLKETVASEGETVVLECRVNEESKPEIRWFKDDKPVEIGQHMVVETLDDGKLKLTIYNATKEDVGSYRCEALNKAGKAETQAKLQYAVSMQETVTDESEQLREMVADELTATAAVETKAGRGPPKFVELLRSCTVTVQQQAVLRCKVKGEPRPKIKWTKEGKEVEMSARIKTESKDDGTLTLTIDEVTEQDAGEYKCHAENELGSAWTEGPIIVTLVGAPKPDGEAPDFVQPVRPVVVVEGETAVLEGKVSGKPKPTVKWYKNGEDIKPSEHFVVESLDDGTQRLTVKNATMEDLDEYRCSASNEFGDVWSDVTLTVKRKPQEAPSFTKTLVEVSVMEGESATYECRATGYPEPEIKWFKDKEEIAVTDEHFVQTKETDGTARLVIKATKVQDSGEIRCEARNPAGTARTDAPLTVTLPEEEIAPEFAQELTACQVKEGELAKFECKVTGTNPAVKWFKDGEELKPGDGIHIESAPDGTNTLVIDKAKIADQGNYRVEATNAAGSMSSKAPLSVQAPETLKIKRPLQDVTVEKGTKILLSVEVEGQPKTVKWYKGTEQVTTTSTIKIERVSYAEYKLEVENCEMSDAGAYRVVLSTESESIESSCTVTVKEKAVKVSLPSFKKGLNDTAVPKGQSLVLEVEVEGAPKAVKWYKNGDQLKDAKAEDLGNGKYRLTIPDFKESDVGEYSVTAENDVGEVESKAKVTVQEPADDSKDKAKPEIVSGLVPTSVKQGETATFTVKVKGPVKGVKWYKNGKEIPDAKTQDKGDGTFELTIPNATKGDAADYKVVVSNDAGDADSAAPLTVKQPQIKIVKGLKDTDVPQKQTGTLEIETSGPPKEVKWYKNGKEITPSDKAQPKKIDDNKYQLVIPDAAKEDTADYKVLLTDEDGNTAESSCALTVKLPAGIEIVKGLEDTSVPQKQTGTLEIETSRPPKQVKWYKNGKEITPSDKAQPKKVGDNKYQLVIPDAGKDDTADYKVVITDDDNNTAESSCALTVKLPAGIEIVKGLEDTSVPQKQTGTLEIETSRPPKQVKWYKNGKEITPSDKAQPKKVDDNKYQLVIPDAGKDDTADYKVIITDDDDNTAESSCALTVKLPAGIEIVKALEDATVPKGQKAVLEVETNRPPKQIKWYKNGKELTPSDKPKAKKVDDNKHQLVIPDADEEDTADYRVVLTDEDDNTADSSCALTVRLPDKEPKIIKGLGDRTVPVGLPTIWEVETEGSPRTVKWYKNGKELTGAAAAQVKITKVDDNHYVLEISKCSVDDTGEYKIEIENDVGKANSSGKLTVEPKLTFLKPLKDQEITEGENADFQVETNAKPASVKWYKNGQETKPDARFVLSEEETKYKLVIKNAVRDDAAEYKIVLSNSAGDADSSAKLTVKKAKPGVPKIIKGLEDQVVAKGASMVFEVKVEGEVAELRWSKDTTPITAGANAVIEKIDENTYRLTIPKADIGDAGHYTVEAINETGKAASDAKGDVDEKPEIVKELNDAEISEGDDEVFKVEVSTPVRTVKWYKNGQEIKPSVHLEPKKVGPKKYELLINRAELDDGATYKVVLSNAAGECDSSAQLTVVKPNILKLLQGLKDIDVDEGQPIELKVKVEGIPKTVKWYKNGTELSPSDAEMKENPETGEYSLVIPQSKKSDGGAYRISLANDKGEIYSGAVAHVKATKPKDTSVPANFLSPLEDTEVAEGETLTLKCVVAGEPFPALTWTKDGVELEKDERLTMRVALDGTATLRIRDARKSDYGQYRITAKNDGGTETSACLVTVKEKGEEPSKPRFIIPLMSCEAEIGEKKMFEVKLRGFPKPTLEWLLNEKPIKFDDRVTVEDLGAGNYCLTIKDIQESDFGTIRCIASNEHGKDQCQAEFDKTGPRAGREKDDDLYPPRFNVPLWDRRIPINDPLAIECHVDAKPVAEIEWFKDGKKLEASEGVEIRNTSDGACRVRIARFGQEDVGVYMCVAKNPLGVADTRSTYSVEVAEKEEVVEKKEYAPRFNPGLEDTTVNVGQAIRLSCSVDAIPKAGIVWYKDGLPLRSGGRFTITTGEDGSCTLDITESVEGDEGAHRCVASNEHGSINTSCMVTVKAPKTEAKKEGDEPYFTKGLVDVWTDRGETFTLKCAVKGDPFPEIKWFRNGTLVRDSPRTTVETAADGTCSLTVKECTMSDEGIYRCEAENKHGKAKTQATTHVQIAIGKSDAPKLEMGSPPRFIIPLEDQTVSIGNIIDLECKVTGEPMPLVKWSKDGGPIWEDSRYEWDVDEAKGTYHLRITSATVHDEGTYRCVATNESGSATTKSFTRIDDGLLGAQIPSKSVPPRFTIRLGDARAIEGQPLQLQCKVEGSPLPDLTWHKDGAEVKPSDRVQITLEPDGTAKLIIPQCCMDDEGIYRVIATNPSGSANDKGNAVVKKAPRDAGRKSAEREQFDANKVPKVIEPLENVKISEKEGFRLRCKFSGEPKLAIKWFKDGERVFPYGRLQLVETPDGVCELIVESSIRQDAGGYRCVAENTFGSARTTCDVVVIQKERKPVTDFDASMKEGKAPGFTVPLTIRRAKPGESVTFECVPYGNPFPQIKWLKDGIEITPSSNMTFEALPDGTQRLHLSEVDFFSEGYFRCVATNEHGTASTKAELCIDGDRTRSAKIIPEEPREPEESKPRIRRGLHNMSIHQGNVVEMIVCATGWPTPTVKWFKDGQEVIPEGPDGRIVTFTDDRGIHHLVILNVRPEDEGDYSLEATNKLGSARTEGALSVIRPRQVDGYGPDDRGGMPFPPGFVRQLKNKHVFNRMPTIFDCLVVGYPAPEVEWLHNGKRIVPGGRVKIQSCGGGSHALIVLDTNVDDAGEYVAVARNCHGTASSSAVLDVTVPYLDNIKFNGEMDVTPYLTEEYGFKKLNYASLPTPPDHGPFIKEVTGHYLTLSWIPTKRAPPRYPQVSYVIEIRELPEKEWTLLDYNIPEPVCKVRNLELGKSYQFRVRAENIYGISDPSPASPPSRLMAPPQPVLDKNKKVIPLLDPYAEKALDLAHAEQYACAPWFAPGVVEKRYCAENDMLTLTLNVAGYPDPEIKWKFRGWDVDTKGPMSQYKVYTMGGTETTLMISGFTKDNVGQYQCFATNAYGEAQQNIMVDLAIRPNFIQPLFNKTFSDAQPVRLDVRVEGQPFPELKWLKEWRPIVESTRVKFVQDGPYLCSLIISDPMWRDSGIYTCIAVNDAGQATTSCSVTVEADGDYNDVELPKKRAMVEARKIREIYEIAEEDETLATGGAPFFVKERRTGQAFLAQLKPIDDSLQRNVDMNNSVDHENIVRLHEVIRDGKLALVVYENATGALLDSFAHPGVSVGEPVQEDRERIVQIFVRQLLFALKHMHDMRIAHLDLRPETILLQDDKLKLADFGQSRRLLRGLITGKIQGTPEFVSPEIVNGYPLTLATDLWSVGTLTYVLLTGISPFHGDDDAETLANVAKCAYSMEGDEWRSFTPEAADFVKHLLKEIPGERMTVDEALDHPWLSDPNLKTSPLSADTLREFKYQHKWLERRVFVQQTPSEQLLEAVLTPAFATAEPKKAPTAESAASIDIYEHLRIKPRPPPPVEEVPKRRRGFADPTQFDPSAPQGFDPRDPRQQPQFDPRDPRNQPFVDPRDPRHIDPRKQGRPPGSPDQSGRPTKKIPLDQYGRLFRPEDLARIPHDSFGRPLDLDQRLPPDQLGRMVQPPDDLRKPKQIGQPVDQFGRPMPPQKKPQEQQLTRPPPDYNAQEKKKLVPQAKGETPSKKEVKRTQQDDADDPNITQVPLRMIRGEHRQIEEEIANRILSDISEEGSVTGSLGSVEDIEALFGVAKKPAVMPPPQSRSRSTTPRAESDASTPTVSPVNTIKEGDLNDLNGLPEKDIEVLERAENDPSIPVGAPLFLEDLHTNLMVIETAPRTPSPAGLSPRRSEPGTKTPVLLSPGREHSMEVIIATKRGKPGFVPPGEIAPEIEDEDARMDERKKEVKPLTHKDEFQDLREKLKREDDRRKADREELERYRPQNFFKDDIDFDRPGYDVDDTPWDSHYQIGPDTYLMATQGPSFNSRVRDYRRNLFGDGAPLVKQGFLGHRNKDITVRERRRYTDILREQEAGVKPKSNENATALQKAPSLNAIERIKADIEKIAPSATRRNADGTFAPIFVSRLRDVYLKKSSFVIFECAVAGSPPPKVDWQFQGSSIQSCGKYQIEQGHSVCRLTISHPASFDLGEYACIASNEYGTDKTTSCLITGEAPSRPGRPECDLTSDTEAMLSWEAPDGPTYLEGITYRLEYRNAGLNDYMAPWVVISESVDDEAAVVRHLQPLGVYQFRVTARNGFGLGPSSLISRLVQTNGRGAPKLPLDGMREVCRFNVLTLPQKTTARRLEEISEESEEDRSRAEPCATLELIAGNPLERFQIESLLFKGKFSVIRHSVDSQKEAGAHCVAKIRSLQGDPTAMREFETLKEAQHENVQHLIAAYQSNGFLYLFCERLFEDVFSRFIQIDYYTEEQVRLTIGQLASALHWLHFRGIVHLDVNPHNVMFQSKRNWIVKLVDFGSAQFTKESVKPAELDIAWAAPELHIKETPVTVQSDVWGMGVIAFCLLGGFHPFTSEYDRPEETKENVMNVKCDPNLIPVNASQEALSFVTWALKKNPLRRMRTDEALSHRFLSSDPHMIRRRESIKYAASRLRKTAVLTKQCMMRPLSTELEQKYGGKVIQ